MSLKTRIKDKELTQDVEAVLEYLWDDESKNYQELPAKNHIFLTMKRLARRINYPL